MENFFKLTERRFDESRIKREVDKNNEINNFAKDIHAVISTMSDIPLNSEAVTVDNLKLLKIHERKKKKKINVDDYEYDEIIDAIIELKPNFNDTRKLLNKFVHRLDDD